MRARVSLLALAGALALLCSCSQRERSNPLDPQNPNSNGAPTGFNAIAGFLAVRLNWDPEPDLAISGFMLHRLLAGDSLYRPVAGLLSKRSGTFLDTGVPNGVEARYRLYFITGSELSAVAAEDVAMPGPVRGSAAFAEWFTAQGPRDARGRSLRDLDLRTRLLRHPLSHLIYGDAFNALPPSARTVVYARVSDVLSGRDNRKITQHLTAADRQAILQILRDTKADLPESFK